MHLILNRENTANRSGNTYNCGQNKWKTQTSRPLQIKDNKMARLCPSRGFILDLKGGWGWGFAFPFYYVQDCRLDNQPLFGNQSRHGQNQKRDSGDGGNRA